MKMAENRYAFGDLTNSTDDELACRTKLKVGDASELEAPHSPLCTTASDFEVLEDTPEQPTNKHGYSCRKEADPVLHPDFQTPQKVPLLSAPLQSLQQDMCVQVPAFPVPHYLGKADDSGISELVALCAADLRDLWETSVRIGGQRIVVLLQKFASMGPPRLATAFFHPPKGTPPPPHAGQWPRRQNGQSSPASEQMKEPLPTVARTLVIRSLHSDDIECRADGALLDLVSNFLHSCHVQSQRRLPKAEAVLRNFPAVEREQILTWLFQVHARIGFQDSVLYTAVLLLDRFCASCAAPIAVDQLQLVMVAVLSISLKMNGAVDENSKPPKLQDTLVHITQQRFTVQDIFHAEHDVLRCLGFTVSMPTAVDMLDTFLAPYGSPEKSELPSPVRVFAQFLLQLSLLDAPLQYRYPHAVLAGAAVYMALWCSKQGPEHVSALLEDVAACFDNRTERT